MLSFCSPTFGFNSIYIRAELPPWAGLRPIHPPPPTQGRPLPGGTAAPVSAARKSRPPTLPSTWSQCIPTQNTRPLDQSSSRLHPPPSTLRPIPSQRAGALAPPLPQLEARGPLLFQTSPVLFCPYHGQLGSPPSSSPFEGFPPLRQQGKSTASGAKQTWGQTQVPSFTATGPPMLAALSGCHLPTHKVGRIVLMPPLWGWLRIK